MTPAQRALILAALGLTPRDGVMPRWSSGSEGEAHYSTEAVHMVDALWIVVTTIKHDTFAYHVTRLGAEAAGGAGGRIWGGE